MSYAPAPVVTPVQLDSMARAGFDADTYSQLTGLGGFEGISELFLNVRPFANGEYDRGKMQELNKRLYSEIALGVIVSENSQPYRHIQREWLGKPRCLGVLTGGKVDATPECSRIVARIAALTTAFAAGASDRAPDGAV